MSANPATHLPDECEISEIGVTRGYVHRGDDMIKKIVEKWRAMSKSEQRTAAVLIVFILTPIILVSKMKIGKAIYYALN
jgi:hypothetical protein